MCGSHINWRRSVCMRVSLRCVFINLKVGEKCVCVYVSYINWGRIVCVCV